MGSLIGLNPVGPATAAATLALEAAWRARGKLVSARQAGHGASFLPVRSGIALTPARASSPPAMITRFTTLRLLTSMYPPVVHQLQSELLRAHRETHRVIELSCSYALT